MAILNEVTQELLLKVVLIGSQGSGKTTNIQSLYKQTSGDVTSRFFDLHSMEHKSPYFDFLPLSLGENRSQALRLHLYSLPLAPMWEGGPLQRQILRGVDGLIWVVDSRSDKLDSNERFLDTGRELLASVQKNFDDIPLVVQLNHRDSEKALSVQALKAAYARQNAGVVEAVAVQDIGVLESVETLTDMLFLSMETQGSLFHQQPDGASGNMQRNWPEQSVSP